MNGIFIGIGVIGTFAIRKLFKNEEFRIANLKRLLQPDLVIMILVASLTVLPWIAWNLIELNRITPVSGEALCMMRLSNSSYPNLVIGSIYTTGTFVANFFVIPFTNIIQGVLVVLLALITPSIVLILRKDDLIHKLISSLDFLVISSVSYYAFYWFYELGFRGWYSLYTSFLVTIVFSTMIVKVIQRIELKKLNKLHTSY